MNVRSPKEDSAEIIGIPVTPIGRWMQPFAYFLQIQSASGFLLLGSTLVALLLANSPLSEAFAGLWMMRLQIALGQFELSLTLLEWINDGLMTIFFFLVGLEIKREFVAGELSEPRKAALPIVAAFGGMTVPALIYLSLQYGRPGHLGWGVPVATDIAFVAGFLSILGNRVPAGLTIMLMSLAIADDIGAILLIAAFYSTNISFVALAIATAGLVTTFIFNRIGIRQVGVYLLLGTAIWLAFLKSGIHPTVAGVLLGFLTPSKAWVGATGFPKVLTTALERLVKRSDESTLQNRQRALGLLAATAREGTSPLERFETRLHPWVAFVIMPIFALANAGVAIELASLGSPVSVAVAAGLIIGKPLGVVTFSWIATRVGLARLPDEVNWRIMLGAGCLAGIGFTMSIFIGSLALEGNLLIEGKLGTMVGSATSAFFGCMLLFYFTPKRLPTRVSSDVKNSGAVQPLAN